MHLIREMQDLAVTFGEVTLHLYDYQITGGCLLHEQGTSEGTAAVTAIYPKGTRITLTGKLVPEETAMASAAAALDAALRGGTTRTITLGKLVCASMRLVGYTLSLGESAGTVKLILRTDVPLTEAEPEPEPEVNASWQF